VHASAASEGGISIYASPVVLAIEELLFWGIIIVVSYECYFYVLVPSSARISIERNIRVSLIFVRLDALSPLTTR